MGAALVFAACTPAPAPAPPTSAADTDPATEVTAFVAQLQPTAAYRNPTAEERRHARGAVDLLLDGRDGLDEATGLLTAIGYDARVGTDPETGREYAIFRTEAGGDRPWGILLVDLSRQVELAIEVPHPNSDLHTEDVGLRLFRAVPGSMLVVAGAHRRAADERADAAHNEDGLFQVVTGRFARRDLNQIQLHGFADKSLPDEDAVVSNGQRRSNAPLRRVADALEDAGFATCRAWTTRCGQLEGTTNTQAEEARRRRSIFIHLEITWAVRRDTERRAALVAALAAAGLTAD
ncbi:hypothetical protein GA0070560_11886 [Micromonospora halophytica]|uniref:N-acetylmuramoyl-L-alanine amidase n=1 Tax=Micromonospora halophytica TaxID=47864 RepID=A0A1C5IYQ1_9ACTN|nr:hypothetical protein GA0070560_11886 [Micromonospora halophytica]